MWGLFRLEKDDRSTVDVKIPVFSLCDKEPQDDNDSTAVEPDNTKK